MWANDPMLFTQDGVNIQIFPIEQFPNPGQRKTDELQRHDLFEANQVAIRIEAIARWGTSARFEQLEAVVVMQGADGDPGPLGKFMRLIGAVHGCP